jgi:hypothetical protein
MYVPEPPEPVPVPPKEKPVKMPPLVPPWAIAAGAAVLMVVAVIMLTQGRGYRPSAQQVAAATVEQESTAAPSAPQSQPASAATPEAAPAGQPHPDAQPEPQQQAPARQPEEQEQKQAPPVNKSALRSGGIWQDAETGLMWATNHDAPPDSEGKEMQEAYCRNLDSGGFSDWRFPTIPEWATWSKDGWDKRGIKLFHPCVRGQMTAPQ